MPTFLDALDIEAPGHLLEGRSLLPLTRGPEPDSWREFAVSEIDYAYREARLALGRDIRGCRGYLIRGDRWKYILWEGLPRQRVDLEDDANELRDLGRAAGLERVRATHHEALFAWMRARKLAVTAPDDSIVIARHTIEVENNIRIGVW